IGGVCHLCHSEGGLGEEVFLKQKFFGTTNPYYFDNFSKTKTYTSFGICQDCDNKLVVGMTHAMNNMRFKVLDLSCIIIPEIDHVSGMVNQAELRAVERVLDQRAGRKDMIDREINTLLNLEKRCRGLQHALL
nr:TM1802 family CRISPR-associated protein [Caldisericia bacterium]